GKTMYEPITDKNDKGEVKEKEKKSEPVNRKGKFMKPGDAIGIKVMEKQEFHGMANNMVMNDVAFMNVF
ncbi:hypothetical protein Tco_0444229, partial [Tanacetum coccineum]